MKIGIDVDDVCANFQKRFVELLHELYGRPPLDTAPIDWNWNWSNCLVSGEEMAAAWKAAARVPFLWAGLEPLASFDDETTRLLRKVIYLHDVFFVTNRFDTPGPSPMKQTQSWLYNNAEVMSSNALISKYKGPMATVLQLDAFIDDRPQNCIDVLEARPNARVYLCDSSHNRTFKNQRIPRMADLKEFLKLMLEAN